ncbi:MAG: hypothetical protein ACXV2A_06460 [Halobacteriota archaeon]
MNDAQQNNGYTPIAIAAVVSAGCESPALRVITAVLQKVMCMHDAEMNVGELEAAAVMTALGHL